MSTKIEWSDDVLNFIEADLNGKTCDPLSNGCKNCFAQVYAKRLKGIEQSKGQKNGLYDTNNETIKVNFDVLERKLKALPKKPKRIFLESMSDLFHKDIPKKHIYKVLDMVKDYPQHTFLILTKRYDRLSSFLWRTKANKLQRLITDYELPSNVHFGISICDNKDVKRYCYEAHSSIVQLDLKLFVSFEPLLERIDASIFKYGQLTAWECDWYIVGAETGNRKRPFNEAWALDILKVAKKQSIPFFFKKQYKDGEWTNELNGKTYLELPKY